MYLHLGSDCMVKNSEIIAIFNLRDPQSEIYKDYVEKYRDRYKLLICLRAKAVPVVF